jgi:hypothetical protein
VTDAPLRARLSAHAFRPSCLRLELEHHVDEHGGGERGEIAHALAGLLHDIDHGACPRCQGPTRRTPDEFPAGSLVTSCRCIPICAECEARETHEDSIGAVYSVYDWYHDRAVRDEVEQDLAELDAEQRSFVIDLNSFDDREHPVV